MIEKKFNKSKVINQLSLPNLSYKNGMVRNNESFVETIDEILTQHNHAYDSIVIGINSPYISHDIFESKRKCNLDQLHEMMPDSKIIHHKNYNQQVATLSVQRNWLAKIYANFEKISSKPVSFVSTDYLKALMVKKGEITMVLDIGYRSTSISIFDHDFLLFYKNLTIGIESLLIALSHKLEVSLIESIGLLKKVDLSRRDSREWIECGGKNFNSERVAETVSFYLEAFTNKILQNNLNSHDKVKTCIITGWGSMIKGGETVFNRYLKNVEISPESEQLEGYMKIKDYLFAA